MHFTPAKKEKTTHSGAHNTRTHGSVRSPQKKEPRVVRGTQVRQVKMSLSVDVDELEKDWTELSDEYRSLEVRREHCCGKMKERQREIQAY